MLLLVGGGLVFFPSDEPEGEGLHTVVGEDGGFGGCGCDIHGVVPLSALLGSA